MRGGLELLMSMNKIAAIPPIWATLVAGYNFDGNTNDVLGVNNGTPINTPTYVAGVTGQAINFDGINQYVNLPNDTFSPSGDWSLSFWVNTDTLGTQFMIDVGYDGTGNGFVMYKATGIPGIRFYCKAGVLIEGAAISTGTWYHIGLSHKAGVDYKIYTNGALSNTLLSAFDVVFPASSPNRIGAQSSSPGNYTDGREEDVYFFDSELTATDFSDLYNSGSGLQYPN